MPIHLYVCSCLVVRTSDVCQTIWYFFNLTYLSMPILQDDFPGLMPLINKYMNSMEIDVDTRCTMLQYLELISGRASGQYCVIW